MKKILLYTLCLFIPSIIYSEVLPDGTKYNIYNEFTGGLNTRDPAHKLKVNESPYIRNCYIDDGEIDPINGTQIIASTPSLQKITLLKQYVKSDGTIEYIVSDSSIVLTTQDRVNYILLKNGLNTSYRLRAKQIENKIWFFNGSDPVFNYNGTTVVVLDGGTYNIGKTPNVPRFKYAEYYQNRLWGFNLPSNSSALVWNMIQSTDVIPISLAPDSEWAWNNSNLQLNIDKGNGTVGTFLRVYAGQLFAGKERGIHYIYGNSDGNYQPVAIVKDYGFLSDESVVEQDNFLYGYGNDGIYEFNGQSMKRISDKIYPDILNINSGVSKNVLLTWDSQSDYARGNFQGTSTATPNGFLTVSTPSFTNIVSTLINTSGAAPPPTVPPLTNVFVNPGYNVFTPTVPLSDTNYGFRISSIAAYMLGSVNGAAVQILVKNARTNEVGRLYYSVINGNELEYRQPTNDAADQPCFTKHDVAVGNLQIGYFTGDTGFNVYLVTGIGQADIQVIPSTTGCASAGFISDIATTTNLTGWGSLNTNESDNNGKIEYFYRAATSPVNIPQFQFTSIVPSNGIFTASSNTYIQWASTITTYSSATLPLLDNLTITYQIGGASDISPFGANWHNKYYLFVTTTVSANTWLCYVRSKTTSSNPYGFTVLEGINAKSSLVTPNIWYLGSSTAGVIMQMDIGKDFNGLPINQIYVTNNNNFQEPFLNKNILEYGLDTDYSLNSSFIVSTSIDGGSFVDQTVSNNSSTGRMIRRLNYPYQRGNAFQWRFANSQLDIPMRIYNWIVYFKDNEVRTNTNP